MAPLPKRTRTVVEDDSEDEVVENGRASSSVPLTSRPNKRVRVSLDTDSTRTPSRTVDGDDDDDDDDDDDVDDESLAGSDDGVNSDSADGFPQTQYELMRDNGFRHLRNIERDDQEAAEKLRLRSLNRVVNNTAAENGIIESVECINFMCHERLHVELGPLMNFIVGENGSGKSAVLTALTLCLGGKASDTNRGGSLKQFVKEGRDQSNLIVKLKNAGSGAYKPDVYGQSIIIERHFSKSGSSGFKIKNEQGKIISTKKQDVDEISEWYSLQMGNPLTVLSQDNARQFLNAATPAQKYKYFVSGVQLEQLDNDYRLSIDMLDQTEDLQKDLAERVERLKRDMEDAKRLAEIAQKNTSLREKWRLYRALIVWSQVESLERDLEEHNLQLTRLEEDLVRRQEDCDKCTKALEDFQEKLSRAQQDRDALKDDRQALEDKVQEAEDEWNEAKQEQTTLQVQERDAHSRLKTCKGEIQTLKSKIQEEERCLGESTGSVRAEKEAEKAAASAIQTGLEAQLQEAKAKGPSLTSSIRDANEALKKVTSSREQKYKEVIAAREALRDLRSSNGPANKGFDPDIIELARAVQVDRGFEQTPLGPIGLHVKLKTPEWSEILEKTLGDSLNAFVVRSKSDQERLSALMRGQRMRRFPPIYIAYGGAIDTSSQEPDEKFDTILRVLDFDNDVVRSQLIINNTIEKIILIKDRTEATRVMIDGREPPRNVSACICFHDGKGKRGHGLRIMNRVGSISSSPIVPLKPPRPRMQSDVVSQVANQQENLKQLDSEFEGVKEEESHAKSLKQRCESELRENQAMITELENRRRQVRADIDQISEALDAFEGVDGRLVALREEAKAKAQEEEQIGMQYGNMAVKKRELMEQVQAAKIKLEAERLELRDYQSRVSKAEDKIKSCESLRTIAVGQKNSAFEDLDIGRENRRALEAKRERKAEEIEDFIPQAQELAPDRVAVPEGETTESLETKYKRIGDQLAQRERRQGGSDEQIFDKKTEATARYEDVVVQAENVGETVIALKHAIGQRLRQWRNFQRQISASVRMKFNSLLSERGFRGEIYLDHPGRKIIIHIEPDQTRKSAAGRNTRTLSGGEKSFSSICMLLAVWEAMGSPIRCLDEFDVFMDNVNRAISTNMLVESARHSISRQYIMITPNAIEGRARLDKDVKIIRLTDPRQRTLV